MFYIRRTIDEFYRELDYINSLKENKDYQVLYIKHY